MRDMSPIPALQDITDRKLLQLVRNRFTARNRAVFEAGADPISRSPDTGYSAAHAALVDVSRIR